MKMNFNKDENKNFTSTNKLEMKEKSEWLPWQLVIFVLLLIHNRDVIIKHLKSFAAGDLPNVNLRSVNVRLVT
jgi:hypothetical protein